MIRTTKTELSRRDQEEFTRNVVEQALDSERYVIWIFRVENGRVYPDHSMRHFADGDYPDMFRYIQGKVAEFVKPKPKEPVQDEDANVEQVAAVLPSEGADNQEHGNGQSEQAE